MKHHAASICVLARIVAVCVIGDGISRLSSFTSLCSGPLLELHIYRLSELKMQAKLELAGYETIVARVPM
jgi:hypothetical protein